MRTLHFFCTLRSYPGERGILKYENIIMKWRESKMKKIVALMMALVLALSLAACSSNAGNDSQAPEDNSQAPASQPVDEQPSDEQPSDEISGTVNTDGSTSMADVMAAFQESFGDIQPGVTINYTASGSGSGITNVLAGTVDIGLSSRALTDEEKAEGAVENIVALDGVAIVVHPENTAATSLTIEQIAQIYTGEISNWSELGGADAPIAVIGRDAASGTRGAFEEIVGVEDACVYTNEYESTGEVIGSVAGNPNAIGYASLSAVDDTVSAVQVNGVAPSEATVADGSYEIQRPFVMVTKEGTELSPAAQAFLDWAMSADAADEVEAAGCVSPNA